MIDLRNKIKDIINKETENSRFSVLNNESVQLIQQIFNNYEVTHDLEQNFNDLPKDADLIFVVAPTGAGKDSLVNKINHENPDKNYIELNMDMFRHYFSAFTQNFSEFQDKTFAQKTNEFSYEMYYTIQEILLEEFPGTNIIITGTLWQTDWIEETLEKYKANEYTNYDITISSLAVPSKDSAFSIIKRYISIIDNGIEKIDDNGKLVYLSDFVPGTARYTSLEYHDETFKKFPENLEYFQNLFENKKYIDHMKVYKRSNKENNYFENTLVYSSDDKNLEKSAVQVVKELRNTKSQITKEDVSDLCDRIKNKKNRKYLEEQDLLQEILDDLLIIFDNKEKTNEKEKTEQNTDDARI